jgi:hypothetical protein
MKAILTTTKTDNNVQVEILDDSDNLFTRIDCDCLQEAINKVAFYKKLLYTIDEQQKQPECSTLSESNTL